MAGKSDLQNDGTGTSLGRTGLEESGPVSYAAARSEALECTQLPRHLDSTSSKSLGCNADLHSFCACIGAAPVLSPAPWKVTVHV